MQVNQQSETILGGKFQLGAKIGSGSFGEIYLAKNVKTMEDLAVKIEAIPSSEEKNQESKSGEPVEKKADPRHFRSQLKREAKIYYKLEGEGNKLSDFLKVLFDVL